MIINKEILKNYNYIPTSHIYIVNIFWPDQNRIILMILIYIYIPFLLIPTINMLNHEPNLFRRTGRSQYNVARAICSTSQLQPIIYLILLILLLRYYLFQLDHCSFWEESRLFGRMISSARSMLVSLHIKY